jgi:ABC-type dipeptide/oligopeptide/nickel transport system permease component
MLGYILRRALLVIPVVWGAMTLLFFVFFLIPGDPVESIAGASGRAVSPAVRANIEARYGLDDPWYVQYGNYWKRTAEGDLGESYRNRRSVNSILAQTAPNSMRLAFWAVVIEVILGISAGVLSAIKRYSFLDGLTTVATTMAMAIPVFVLGYLFQYMLGVYAFQNQWPDWARFPVQGIGPNSWSFGVIPTNGQWRYLLLPALTLASVSTALVARMMRSTMLEVARADYLRTAVAKGLSRRRVVFKHGLRNALIPVVTLIGLDLANLVGAAILTETVFNWPGMGTQVARAIQSQDAPVVLGLTLVIVVIYVTINLIVDLSYGLLDPRIRYGTKGES